MARIRNQNSVPAAAITIRDRTTASAFDATSSDRLAVITDRPRSARKPSTAPYLRRHINTAATAISTANTRPPATLRRPPTLVPTATRITLATAISPATTPATGPAVRPSAAGG